MGKIIESAQISQLNYLSERKVLELIKEDFSINSDKPMGSFEGRRISQEVLNQIEENETINLSCTIWYLEGRRQVAESGESVRQNI